MKNINIGTIKIPITAATKSFAVLAKRGAGKTYTAAVIAEEFSKANIPFVVFDPIDVWWGLRLAADGKGKGLPVVVFGLEHADIQITRDMGAKIAQAIVRENISCVISTFGMPKVAQRHLIAEFSEELIKINNTPRHVFIEEAHEFVPQRIQAGMGKCFSAVEALVVMGRNRGIGVTLINQRAATLNKDVLTQVDTLLAFRNVAPQDRKALKEWVEAHSAEEDFDAFFKSLPSLPTGEGWIWSPEFMGVFQKINIRKRETFHPDREKLGVNFKIPTISQTDIAGFIDSFVKKPESVKPKTEQVTQANVVYQTDSKIIEKAVSAALQIQAKDFEKERQSWRNLVAHYDKIHLQASNLYAGSKMPEIYLANFNVKKIASYYHPSIASESTKTTEKEVNAILHDTSGFELAGPEKKILNSLAWMEAIGITTPERPAIAFLAGYSNTRSTGFTNPCGTLRSKGLIEYPNSDTMKLTETGRSVAEAPEIAPTAQRLQEIILTKLPGPEQRVLEVLINKYPESVSNAELAIASGYSNERSTGYTNPRGRLRSFGLIEYLQGGYVKARALLFLG